MTINEAIMWLDKDQRETIITALEEVDGFDASDFVLAKISEACRIACRVMHKYLRIEEAVGGACEIRIE